MGQHRLSRRLLVLAAALAAGLGIDAGIAPRESQPPGDNGGPNRYTIGLFGDMPYNAQGKATTRTSSRTSTERVAFSTFDGDLKAGGDGPCSDSLYTTAIAGFNSLRAAARLGAGRQRLDGLLGPLRAGTQPYSDPIERLNHERQLFTSTNRASARKRSRSRAVERGRRVLALLRERPVDVRPGRLPRPQRPGVERQLPVPRTPIPSRARTRRSSASGPRRSRARQPTSTGSTRDSSTRSGSAPRAC